MGKKKICGIYKITSPTGRVYIGQSTDIDKRKAHYMGLHCPKQTVLLRSLIKYGWENHVFEIKEECSVEDLNTRERYWQDFYNSVCNGMNCQATKTSDKSGYLSEEMKSNISKAKKGKRFLTEDEKIYLSKLHKGKRKSETMREKLSLAKKGKPVSKNCEMAKIEAVSKVYRLISPDGDLVVVKNLSNFSRENSLGLQGIFRVVFKSRPHYKGWRLFENQPLEKFNFKYYSFINTDGTIVENIICLKVFCLQNGLNPVSMGRVSNNNQIIHKGWRNYNKDVVLDFKPKMYYFIDPIGKKVVLENLTNFVVGTDLKMQSLSDLTRGKISMYKGWKRDEDFYENEKGAD